MDEARIDLVLVRVVAHGLDRVLERERDERANGVDRAAYPHKTSEEAVRVMVLDATLEGCDEPQKGQDADAHQDPTDVQLVAMTSVGPVPRHRLVRVAAVRVAAEGKDAADNEQDDEQGTA